MLQSAALIRPNLWNIRQALGLEGGVERFDEGFDRWRAEVGLGQSAAVGIGLPAQITRSELGPLLTPTASDSPSDRKALTTFSDRYVNRGSITGENRPAVSTTVRIRMPAHPRKSWQKV